jgi:hypothetical protein
MWRASGVPLEHPSRFEIEDAADIGPQANQCLLVDRRRPQLRPSVEVLVVGIDIEQLLQLAIRLHLDARGIAHPEHDRHAVGLFVAHRCQHTFARRRGHVRLIGSEVRADRT